MAISALVIYQSMGSHVTDFSAQIPMRIRQKKFATTWELDTESIGRNANAQLVLKLAMGAFAMAHDVRCSSDGRSIRRMHISNHVRQKPREDPEIQPQRKPH